LGLDLRIVFLFLLFVTAILFTLRKGPALEPEDVKFILLDFLLVPALIGTVATFALLITRTDPMSLYLQITSQISGRVNVSFLDAIPPHLRDSLEIVSVGRHDTDGDTFEEWVVFYKFDLQSGNSPIYGAVYDSDRGNPPVIFPYRLSVPGRDYLSEDGRTLTFELEPITTDQNGPDGQDLPEIKVSDANQLALFRFQENSALWDFPRDAPPRYQPIGFFRGSGGVSFDDTTKNVTVIDRDDFERSQLAVRSVYALNQATNSYWDNFDSQVLAAPIISTIDFFADPPNDVFTTAFPEKIVLAYYASNCTEADDTLCRNANVDWNPQDFLAADALTEYQNGNAEYFGLSGFGNVRSISVSELRYYPRLETDADLLVSGSGRDVVTGEEAQFNVVDIAFIANGAPLETARYEMGQVDGQWKIQRRVAVQPLSLDAPTQIPAQE